MIQARLNKTLTSPLRDPHSKDFYSAFGVAILVLLLHTYTLIVEFSRASEVEAFTSHTVSPLLLIIELCLLLCVAGLWTRKVAGLLISLLSLLGTGSGYVFWYLDSRQFLEKLSSHPFYHLPAEAIPSHPFGLIGATWISVIVLTLSSVLLIWEAKTLRSLSKALNKGHTKP